ncbi:MAG: UDP-glucose/GDP-mannose dehydrogenase family protein [Hyphomicrobiaceae bacterium]
MRLAVVGVGYVGLVSGACLASKGHQVVSVDVDPRKVAMVNERRPPIYEAGLQELLDTCVPSNLRATTDLKAAIHDSEISLIAVGTPFNGDEIDLKYIREVARQIGTALADHPGYHTVVVKSTVVPGTTEDVVLPILEQASGKKAGRDFGVGMNPEFLREGEAISDFMFPDRVVIGGIDERSIAAQRELYAVFPDLDVLETTPRAAEMVKYTANSLLATLISFSNEMGNLAQAVGVDERIAMKGVHLDKRFSPILEDGRRVRPGMLTYLAAGCGFGGSCFPKDVQALIAHGQKAGLSMQLLRSVIEVNKAQPGRMLEMLRAGLGDDLQGRRIAVLGVAFKPGTDDIRESPSLPVIEGLLAAGASVVTFDTIARRETEHLYGDRIGYAEKLGDAIDGADAILIMTAWPEFRELPAMIAPLARQPLVVDGRRLIDKDSVARYAGIGLPPMSGSTASPGSRKRAEAAE